MRSRYFLVTAGAVALLLTSCAATENESSGPGATSGELTTITIGASPSVQAATTYLADENGAFAEQGLKVKLVTVQAGSTSIPQLMSGDLDIAITDVAGTITASVNGVDLTVTGVTSLAATTSEGDDTAILVKSSEIKSVKDLEGKTVATNQLTGALHLVALAGFESAGGDPEALKFVEMPMPNMVDAVAAGNVDAAIVPDPFRAIGLSKGLHEVLRPNALATPGLPTSVFTASAEYAKKNDDVIKRFNAALSNAAKEANSNPEVVRKAAGFTGLDSTLLEKITFPTYAEEAQDVSGVRQWADLLTEYGFLKQKPNFDVLLRPVGS